MLVEGLPMNDDSAFISKPEAGNEVACVCKPETGDEVDEAGYLEANPDVTASGLSARGHFLARGQAEGRLQSINSAQVRAMRELKLGRVRFQPQFQVERDNGKPANFLTSKTIKEFAIPESPPVSAHPYPALVVQLIHDNRDKLFVDIGAGLRDIYYRNVVNTEIYPSISTDVLCVGEALPFADAQFDFAFCFATLEHTRRPWDVASEICRVLKPGGTVMIDYPFLQPVHGYPHHYFNATPRGNQSLFEHECEIRSLEIGWHQHPMVGMQWALTVFRDGLPDLDARQFEDLQIKDLLGRPLDALLDEAYCRNLDPEMQKVIASGSMLVAVKKPSDSRSQPSMAGEVDAGAIAQQRAADTEFASLKRQNMLLKAQIVALRNSTSWQLTSPLRFIERLLHPKQD